jgi:hypothetical protein
MFQISKLPILVTVFCTIALTTLGIPLVLASEEGECKTIDDVDEDKCKIEDLSVEALREVCGRLGLSVENQVFPYLFDEEVEGDEDELTPESKPVATKERTHDDYIKAAIECLSIEEEMEGMLLDEDEDLQSFFEQDLLEEDPEMLTEIMAELLTNDGNLLAQIEKQIKEEDPELYQELLDEMNEDEGDGKANDGMLKSLKDRPDLVAEVLSQMIMNDPSMLEDFDMEGDDFEMAEGMDAYFDLNEDEPDDEDAEDLEAIKRHMAGLHDEM